MQENEAFRVIAGAALIAVVFCGSVVGVTGSSSRLRQSFPAAVITGTLPSFGYVVDLSGRGIITSTCQNLKQISPPPINVMSGTILLDCGQTTAGGPTDAAFTVILATGQTVTLTPRFTLPPGYSKLLMIQANPSTTGTLCLGQEGMTLTSGVPVTFTTGHPYSYCAYLTTPLDPLTAWGSFDITWH